MCESLRPSKGLFFILFVFIFSVSAQTIRENNRLEDVEEKSATQKTIIKKVDSLTKKKDFSTDKKLSENLIEEDVNEPPEDYKLRRGDKELQIEFGISPFNPSNFAGPKVFDVYGRHLYMANFRVGRVIGEAARKTARSVVQMVSGSVGSRQSAVCGRQ